MTTEDALPWHEKREAGPAATWGEQRGQLIDVAENLPYEHQQVGQTRT